ncbi:MAG: hypothetical protein HY319_30825 [Armatimonadetes bacterium]|nr:hypothetical protein [Armatimonadota bacterium]
MLRRCLLFLILTSQLGCAQEFYTCLAFSPDGRHLAAGRSDGLLHVWEMPFRQRFRHVPQMADSPIYEVAWYGTDTVLCRGLNQAGPFLTWSKVKKLFRFPANHEGVCGAFSPDGKLLLTDSRDKITIWEIHFGKQVCDIEFPTSRGSQYQFSPDCKRVAVSRDTAVVVFDAATGKRVSKLKKDAVFAVTDLAFTPEGTLLTHDKHAVREWNVETGVEVSDLGRGYSFAYSDHLLLSADGRGVLASGSTDDGWKTQYWPDRKDENRRRELPGYAVAFLPGGGAICSDWGEQGVATLTVHREGQPPVKVELPGLDSPVTERMALSPDGKLLVYACGASDELKWVTLPSTHE